MQQQFKEFLNFKQQKSFWIKKNGKMELEKVEWTL